METKSDAEKNVFGIWAFDPFFARFGGASGVFVGGGYETIEAAKTAITEDRSKHPTRSGYKIHACRLGWYERGFDTEVFREPFPSLLQSAEDERRAELNNASKKNLR